MHTLVVDEVEWIDYDTASTQTMWMEMVCSNPALDENGLIDWGETLPSDIHSNDANYCQATFGEHGRVAHYTEDVDEPIAEVIGESSNKGGGKQKKILDALREYATVGPDGLVDIDRVLEEADASARAVWGNVGRHVRVLVPYDEYDSTKSGSTRSSLPEYLSGIVEEDQIPNDPIEAFQLGWDKRRAVEKAMRGDL